MFRFIKQVLITLSSFGESFAKMANISNFTTCISLNNQPCITKTTLINLNPDEDDQGLQYYPFMDNLDRCNRSCNTFDDPSARICVPNKKEIVDINVFNMIKRINESKILKHISCDCTCKFDEIRSSSDQKWKKELC